MTRFVAFFATPKYARNRQAELQSARDEARYVAFYDHL